MLKVWWSAVFVHTISFINKDDIFAARHNIVDSYIPFAKHLRDA